MEIFKVYDTVSEFKQGTLTDILHFPVGLTFTLFKVLKIDLPLLLSFLFIKYKIKC